MLDERVRAVLEAEDTPLGRFLFAVVTPQNDCGVLEIGACATIWLAAGVRYFSGRVVTVESDPAKRDAWVRSVAEAGLEEWTELAESLEEIEDVFDVVVIAPGQDAGQVLPRVRDLVEPGALIVSTSAPPDPTLLSVAVTLDRGLELSVVLE
jgi:predicted O-methyltransferase YrrM